MTLKTRTINRKNSYMKIKKDKLREMTKSKLKREPDIIKIENLSKISSEHRELLLNKRR